ncbi:c-type cytochrome [Pseudoroseicyclus aestuarii]|nr:cytochrome c family protein [Pseudoroseicyclus aestuarii]
MTGTKLVGAVCGALLVFLLGGYFAGELYSMGGHHHPGEEEEQAYIIPVEETGGAAEEAAPEVPFEELWASADASAGEAVFRNCRSCHALEAGDNRVGPTLYDVVGRPVDSVEGYAYSGALEEVVDEWTPEHIFEFLHDPRGYAPGTKMTYAGLPSAEDRVNLIAWLETNPGG